MIKTQIARPNGKSRTQTPCGGTPEFAFVEYSQMQYHFIQEPCLENHCCNGTWKECFEAIESIYQLCSYNKELSLTLIVHPHSSTGHLFTSVCMPWVPHKKRHRQPGVVGGVSEDGTVSCSCNEEGRESSPSKVRGCNRSCEILTKELLGA